MSVSNHILPLHEYQDTCAISFENLRTLAERAELVVTVCGHKFSVLSLGAWLERKQSCPTCRQDLTNTPQMQVVLKVDEVARNSASYSSSSSSSSSAPALRARPQLGPQEVNGDLSEEEALQAVISSTTAPALNGDLTDEEALAIALAIPLPPPAEHAERALRINGDLSEGEALAIAIEQQKAALPQSS